MSVTNKSMNILVPHCWVPVVVTGYVTLGPWSQSFGSTVVGPKKPYPSQGLHIRVVWIGHFQDVDSGTFPKVVFLCG